MSEPTDVKEILNVLNVGELRDLLHMVNKVCHIHGHINTFFFTMLQLKFHPRCAQLYYME